jgi:hypothetical protein
MELAEEAGVLEVTAIKDRAATYTSTVTGVPPHPPPLTTPGLFGGTTLHVMNLPVWREEDDQLGVYVAARGTLDGFASLLSAWFGTRVFLSGDGGETYRAVADVPAVSTIGHVTSAVAAWHNSETPSTTTLTVSLPRAPSSLGYAAMLRYGNQAALQLDDGTWEILQYQTVTAGANNTYTLTGVVRGRYATTPGTASAGNAFVLLDNAVKFVPIEQWVIGADDLMVKGVSYGTSADAVTGQALTLDTAVAQTEWAPSCVQATRDGADNVTVTWVGRGRIGAETAARHSVFCTGYRITYSDGATFDVGPTVSTHTRPSTPASQTITVCGLNAYTGEGTPSTGVTA